MSSMSPTPPPPPPHGARHSMRKKPTGPRKVRHGVKLKSDFDFAAQSAQVNAGGEVSRESPKQNWPALRWWNLARARFGDEELNAGLEYARAGQIVSVDVTLGTIDALVQGTASRPYQTALKMPALSEQQWERVVQSMVGEAVYVAKLMANEWPAGLDELFTSIGLRVLPDDAEALMVECTCAEAKPCKHGVAAAAILADRLAADPLLLLSVLGLSAERLVDRLRRAHRIHTHGVASAHADALIPESQIDPLPLELCMESFWRDESASLDATHDPGPKHAPHALLRRLGPSPMNGKFPMFGLLASVYDAVSAAAQKMRDEAGVGGRNDADSAES